MSILDQLLGGSDNESASRDSSTSDFDFGTSPVFGLGVSDVLRSSSEESDDGDTESSDFVGIGDLGIGLAAPTFLGISSSNDSASAQSSDGDSGGLLGGLL